MDGTVLTLGTLALVAGAGVVRRGSAAAWKPKLRGRYQVYVLVESWDPHHGVWEMDTDKGWQLDATNDLTNAVQIAQRAITRGERLAAEIGTGVEWDMDKKQHQVYVPIWVGEEDGEVDFLNGRVAVFNNLDDAMALAKQIIEPWMRRRR